jgi:hypothetical protein
MANKHLGSRQRLGFIDAPVQWVVSLLINKSFHQQTFEQEKFVPTKFGLQAFLAGRHLANIYFAKIFICQ